MQEQNKKASLIKYKGEMSFSWKRVEEKQNQKRKSKRKKKQTRVGVLSDDACTIMSINCTIVQDRELSSTDYSYGSLQNWAMIVRFIFHGTT